MTAGNSILIVDLDTKASKQLSDALTQEGYIVTSVFSGHEALSQLQHFPDLIILDPRLPDMSGMDFIRTVKQQAELSNISIIILSNKETETDEIISLEVGADDFLVKPVTFSRLLARIRTLLRRQLLFISPNEEEVISIAGIDILVSSYTIHAGDDTIPFTRKEFEILLFLARNYGRVVTRKNIFRAVWGSHLEFVNRSIDVHIGRIRKKLNAFSYLIETVPGVGYRFRVMQIAR